MKKIFLSLFIITIKVTLMAQNVGINTPSPEGKLHIKGSADTTQLVIDANSVQSNLRPLFKLRNSNGTDLLWIHSDHESNTFFGINAGRSNDMTLGGNHNTFIGSYSGYSNTVGDLNTTLGGSALYSNTSGRNNTCVGFYSLYLNSTAGENTAIGNSALYAQSFNNANTQWASANTAVGSYALMSNEPTSTGNGIANTAVGHSALRANTTGYDNTAVGTTALYSNTTGLENTAAGRQALFYNTSGEDNTAMGYKALRNNDIGFFNTGFGSYAVSTITNGVGNSGFGYYANTSTTGLGNATALGYSATVNANAKVRIGNALVTTIEGQVGYSWPSDGRFKENITNDVKGLEFILKLKPVSYNFNLLKYSSHVKEHIALGDNKAFLEKSKFRSVGFIAQDVEKSVQETGFTSFRAVHPPTNETDNYSLGYAEFVVPLVKAVQEQQSIIEQQNKKIEFLLKEMQTLKDNIKQLP